MESVSGGCLALKKAGSVFGEHSAMCHVTRLVHGCQEPPACSGLVLMWSDQARRTDQPKPHGQIRAEESSRGMQRRKTSFAKKSFLRPAWRSDHCVLSLFLSNLSLFPTTGMVVDIRTFYLNNPRTILAKRPCVCSLPSTLRSRNLQQAFISIDKDISVP